MFKVFDVLGVRLIWVHLNVVLYRSSLKIFDFYFFITFVVFSSPGMDLLSLLKLLKPKKKNTLGYLTKSSRLSFLDSWVLVYKSLL